MDQKKKDIEVLSIVRKYLIDNSSCVYRSYEFFFQAENKPQRRKIYNEDISFVDGETYSVVCKSYCEAIKKDLVSLYGLNVSVISCDNDEFGHCDILIDTGNKYIINCLSDLERNQMGMSPKRFASLEYTLERYPDLADSISYLTSDEMRFIDEQVGFISNGVYFDDTLEVLKSEFENFELNLRSDSELCSLLGLSLDNLSDEELLKGKFRFLFTFLNDRQNIIGHIELVRIYKLLIRKLFNKDEIRNIKCFNCFSDNLKDLDGIFDLSDTRIRFICTVVYDEVYLVSTVSNKFMCLSLSEWQQFKEDNCIFENSMIGSNDSISEVLRNKGIGVNIIKHSVVKNLLFKIEECIYCGMSELDKKELLKNIASQDNKVFFVIGGDRYLIELDNTYIKIGFNEDVYTFYYLNDNLVSESSDAIVTYLWYDEGKYKENVYRKS